MTTHLELSSMFTNLTNRVKKDPGVPKFMANMFRKDKAIEKACDFLASVAPPEYFRIHQKIQLPKHSAFRGSGLYNDLSSMDPHSMEFISEAQSLLLPLCPQEVLHGLQLLQSGYPFSIRSRNKKVFIESNCKLVSNELGKLVLIIQNRSTTRIALVEIDTLVVSNSIAINSRLTKKARLTNRWSFSLRVDKNFYDFKFNSDKEYSTWYHTFSFLMREQNLGADRNPSYIIALRNWYSYINSAELPEVPINKHVYTPFASFDDSGSNSVDEGKTITGNNDCLSFGDIRKLFRSIGVFIPKAILHRACEVIGKNEEGSLSFHQFAHILRETHNNDNIAELFDRYTRKSPWMREDMFMEFLKIEQNEKPNQNDLIAKMSSSGATPMEDGILAFNREGFFRFLFSRNNYVVSPTIWTEVFDKMDAPLPEYWISTNYDGIESDTSNSLSDYLKKLTLSSCRNLEMECFDGEYLDEASGKCNAIPMVKVPLLSGNAEPISLQYALQIISKNVFLLNPFPFIITLRNNCSTTQQLDVVDNLRGTLGKQLFTLKDLEEYHGKWPSPNDLKGRILISLISGGNHGPIRSMQDISALWYHSPNSRSKSEPALSEKAAKRTLQLFHVDGKEFLTLAKESPETLYSFALSNLIYVRNNSNHVIPITRPLFFGCQMINCKDDDMDGVFKLLYNYNSRCGFVRKPDVLLPNPKATIGAGKKSIGLIKLNERVVLRITLLASSMLPRGFSNMEDKFIPSLQINQHRRGSTIVMDPLADSKSHFVTLSLISLSSVQTKRSNIGKSNIFTTEWNETFDFTLGSPNSAPSEFLRISVFETDSQSLQLNNQRGSHSMQDGCKESSSNLREQGKEFLKIPTLSKRRSTSSMQFNAKVERVDKFLGEQLLRVSDLRQGYRMIPLCHKSGKFLNHGGVLVKIEFDLNSFS